MHKKLSDNHNETYIIISNWAISHISNNVSFSHITFIFKNEDKNNWVK